MRPPIFLFVLPKRKIAPRPVEERKGRQTRETCSRISTLYARISELVPGWPVVYTLSHVCPRMARCARAAGGVQKSGLRAAEVYALRVRRPLQR